MIIAGLVVIRMPETATRRAGAIASLTPRASIPAHLRMHITPVVPVLIAGWALGGLYFSLGPSVAAGVFKIENHLIGGIVITLLCGTAAVTSFFARPIPAPKLGVPAALSLSIGALISLAGLQTGQVDFAVIGTIVAGAGFGAGAVAAFGTVARYARPDERGALISAVYVISYLAFSIPALIAGVAANQLSLGLVTEIYLLVVLGLGLTATILGVAASRRRVRESLPAGG